VFLGGLSSLLYGVGDFLGGEGAKRVSAATVVVWAGVVSLPVIAIVAVSIGGETVARDWWYGAIAGSMGGLGLVALFTGLGRGHAAAVAPAAAAVGAVFPVAVAVLRGDSLSALTWLGVTVAIPAIVLCSWVAEPGDTPAGGLWYGVVAGLGFGSYTVVIDLTSSTSNLLPLIPARGAPIGIVVVISLTGVWRIHSFARSPRAIVVANGVLDAGGNVALLAGLRSGSLAAVAVAASFYPAVTVMMARMINREHLRGRQLAGLALTLAALAAIAVG
jgi:drug/metabolite transporter (DMT)-like permease